MSKRLGFDDAPPPLIEDIRTYLVQRCYSPSRANALATHCWIMGTTKGCPDFLSEEDRCVIQDFLDGCEDAYWEDFDDDIWTTTEEQR